MAGKSENQKKKKWLWIAPLCVLAAVIAVLLSRCGSGSGGPPTLTVETPQKRSASAAEEFTLDVTISDLGDARYPAMSMSIRFDPSRLEFLGLREGNVFIYDDKNSTGRQLPDWSCNVQTSNATGLINIMYLDMTGGKYAFSRELLGENDNVVVRLCFRLRGSARAGDVMDVTLEDAVFAASDESRSLAMTTQTLKTKNGRILVGE